MSNYSFNKSKIFLEKASKLIPMASQTYSKSYVNFDLNKSPMFLDRGNGSYVWDIDNNKYLDYIMALLPNILGYNDKEINNSINKQLKKGISFSLATTLEYELAKLLVEIVPSADMVRFAKNGSDVTGAAIRLSRAITSRKKIIVCGYHGWHDWYIGSTEKDLGVPEEIKKLTVSVEFNNFKKIKSLFERGPCDYAALIIEPEGSEIQNNNFLKKIRAITKKYKTILIFDEIVSGFRVDIGGAQRKYNVIPDLTTLGKAMANGMPLSALVGKRKFMKLNEEIFFSGTFSGEALSLAASLATIKKLKNENITEQLLEHGLKLKNDLNNEISSLNLDDVLEFQGPDWRPFLKVIKKEYINKNLMQKIRNEFINEGILFGTALNLSLPHIKQNIYELTLKKTSNVLKQVKKIINANNFGSSPKVKKIFNVRNNIKK